MAKLTIFAALFATLVVIASATTYTTVVTTTEENPTTQSCQQEMQMKRMNHCRMWMKQGQWSMVANPQYSEEHLDECCDQLRSISSQCRCDAIRGMMMDMQQTYGMEKMEKMRKMAESLPKMCNMDYPSECRMRAVYF